MSSTLTLLTADTPPISIQASRIALQANSKVFSDMLSLPSSLSEDNSVTLAQTEKEIRPFLEVVQGEGGKKGSEVEKLDEEGWENLARLADKFDSPVVMQLIEKRIWELQLKEKSPLHAFTLATFANKRELLTLAAYSALGVKDRESTRFGASQEWKDRLDTFAALRMSHVYRGVEAVHVALSPSSCYSRGNTCRKVEFLLRAIVQATGAMQPASKEWLDLGKYKEVPCTNGYASCVDAERSALAAMRRAWQEPPAFPHGE